MRQTVSQAELVALAMALEETTGSRVYVADCQPVLEGWVAGRAHGKLGPNQGFDIDPPSLCDVVALR